MDDELFKDGVNRQRILIPFSAVKLQNQLEKKKSIGPIVFLVYYT